MSSKITIVFPCAGSAERFGNTFKPFIKIGDLTFIEKAYEPFRKWDHMINSVCFLITKKQELEYNVVKRMHSLFPDVSIRVSILEEETSGPVQTFTKGFVANNNDLRSPFIVCDCDHSINVDNLFEDIEKNRDAGIIIPTWNITEDTEHNWSKILLRSGKIEKFVNKEKVDFEKYTVKGIIGCIYFQNCFIFQDIRESYHNFYEIISDKFAKNTKIVLSDTSNAYFFGDPTMLKTCIEKRRNECSIFCDIDGVLLKHNDHSTNDETTNECLDGSEILSSLKNANHKIILTTARNEKNREALKNLLRSKNIHYDDLIMSLPSGPRILINDRKPSKPFTPQADSYEVRRDSGLACFSVEDNLSANNVKIIQDLSANSFAKTYLIEDGEEHKVRKQILKTTGTKHVESLKRQKRDLQRFNFLYEGICPEVYGESETNYDYYYDMEYLPKFKTLSEIDCVETRILALSKTLQILNDNVYSLSKQIDGDKWMKQFLEEKIYPKFDNFKLLSKEFETIIESKEFTINNTKYTGLRRLFDILSTEDLCPDNISVIHGDLTYENIMYNEDDLSVILIDMDGSRIFDAKELDLGKLAQSIFSNYNKWKNVNGKELVKKFNFEDKSFDADGSYFNKQEEFVSSRLLEIWQSILGQQRDLVTRKVYFYMSTYFIRFVPFRMQICKEHGIFALLMATVWLNKLLKT